MNCLFLHKKESTDPVKLELKLVLAFPRVIRVLLARAFAYEDFLADEVT